MADYGGVLLEDLRKRLDSEDWDDHLERLTLYAKSLIRRLKWRGEQGGPVPGKDAVDIALDAIADVYACTRRWNPASHPVLIKFLFDAVKSEISNAVRAKSNQENWIDPDKPEAAQRDAETDVLMILDFVEDDPDLHRYVDCILGGCDDRADLAERLGIAPTQVDNLRRRMQRRLDAYYDV